MPHYLVYGLKLWSNREIPGLVPLSEPCASTSQVNVYLGEMPHWIAPKSEIWQEKQPWYISQDKDETDRPLLSIWNVKQGDYLCLIYSDQTQFILDHYGTNIWATWPKNLTLEDTAIYLLGPVLGLFLRLKGVTCLHASAVVIDGKGVLFVGDAGAGKSTTAAAFAHQGYPILSDDVAALVDQEDGFLIQPAYPRLRLWSESVTALYGSPAALPRMVPNHPSWDKRYLDLTQSQYQFQQQPQTLNRIYLLGERQRHLKSPLLEDVSTQEGLVTLVQNTYGTLLLDKIARAKEFEVLSRLITFVSVRKVSALEDGSRLPQLVGAIVQDLTSVKSE